MSDTTHKIINHTGGIISAGNILSVLRFLISRIESPDDAIKNPPTTLISHISSGLINSPKNVASK